MIQRHRDIDERGLLSPETFFDHGLLKVLSIFSISLFLWARFSITRILRVRFAIVELAELPTGREAIGCRWVHASRNKPDGNFDKAKAATRFHAVTPAPRFEVPAKHELVVLLCYRRTINGGLWPNSIDDVEVRRIRGDTFSACFVTIHE